MNPLLNFGIQLIQSIQVMSPALDGIMEFFSFLGAIEFYLVLLPMLYWVVDTRLGMRALLILVGTDILGTAFKQILHQPRPYWVGEVKALAEETSYGIPSTHASNSLAMWGYLAYRLKKNWLWGATVLLVLLIGLSRLYLGVHFPQDVLGGWLLGAVVIYLFARYEPVVSRALEKQTTLSMLLTSLGISIVVLLVGQVVGLLIAASPDPVEWAHYALRGRDPSRYFMLAGALFGAISGYTLMRARLRYQTRGMPLQLAARYILGIAGVLVIYAGLDVLFSLIAADDTIPGYILRYIRYACVTFWIACGAPWMFLKLRLAQSSD